MRREWLPALLLAALIGFAIGYRAAVHHDHVTTGCVESKWSCKL